MNLCIVQPNRFTTTETFLQAQEEQLPACVTVLFGIRPKVKGQRLSVADRLTRLRVRAASRLGRKSSDWEATQLFRHTFARFQPDVVLAQYGSTGVRAMDACRLESIPLVVHFHGFDAANRETLDAHRHTYPKMFDQAAAIIGVSRAMTAQLKSLGAPAEKLHCIHYGVDCERFAGAGPAAAPPVFLTVGRFVEKKAPHLVILSFTELYQQHPQARLRMIGDGEMLPFCQELVKQLRICHAVEFLGAQPHDVVSREMQRARAFVQHSVVATCGDSEGTPVAVIEAGATGLPVIATRHAGIPDVVVEGETGLLVDEHDVYGMTAHMKRVVEDPVFAVTLGAAAQRRVRSHFSIQQSIGKLWAVIQKCAAERTNELALPSGRANRSQQSAA